MYAAKSSLAMNQIEIVFLVDIYKICQIAMDGFFFIPMAFSCLYLWKVLSCGFECIKGKNHPC